MSNKYKDLLANLENLQNENKKFYAQISEKNSENEGLKSRIRNFETEMMGFERSK